jgi:DNA-binding NtrC family response regulator
MNPPLNPPQPILIVDDEESILLSIDTALRMAGFDHLLACPDSRRVMDLFAEHRIEILLLDLTMPHVSGFALLKSVTQDYPGVPVIIVTGAVDVETAVECMRQGAFDYVMKPVEQERLVTAVKRALAFRDLQRENLSLKQHLLSARLLKPQAFQSIVTQNKSMLSIFSYIESIAQTSQGVLIRGETGVGKELIARALHQASGLKGQFVAVNVAGLDDNVFADTLFGHVKGAFTGAEQARRGLVEQAAGGTLFLDEIGDLSTASQVKLLRMLQEGEYLPLGQDIPKMHSARIVASTNRDLWELQKEGKFRKDLNFRLRTHRVYIPPLRDRMDDIPLLLDHFLAKAAAALQKKKPTPVKELLALLNTYTFPGNVRELQAMVFDAVSTHQSGVLGLDVFRSHIQAQHRREQGSSEGGAPMSGNREMITFPVTLPTIKQATWILVDEALQRAGGNQSIAAEMLGITQQALSKRLKKAAQQKAP